MAKHHGLVEIASRVSQLRQVFIVGAGVSGLVLFFATLETVVAALKNESHTTRNFAVMMGVAAGVGLAVIFATIFADYSLGRVRELIYRDAKSDLDTRIAQMVREDYPRGGSADDQKQWLAAMKPVVVRIYVDNQIAAYRWSKKNPAFATTNSQPTDQTP